MLGAIDPHHSALFQREACLATLSLEIINAEVLNVVEVLLCLGAIIPQVSPPVEASGRVARVLAIEILL